MKAFECKMCGECCYGEGGININEEEIKRISGFLGLTAEALLDRYCYYRNNKVSIKSGPDGFCIFFDKNTNCRIHTVKPEICSLWPFFPALRKYRSAWKLAQEACPGINSECSHEEFVKQANKS
jgi:Fe-S-cluster containining protein